jgi:hypothetical protein
MNSHQGEVLAAADGITAALRRPSLVLDQLHARGRFIVRCFDARGRLRWEDEVLNTVVTVGKNLILDQSLAGAAYTATEFLGLISSVSYSAISAADTMTSHAGWTEAGTTNAPTFSGNRGACPWSVASGGSKALSTNPSFSITGTGTLKGAFMVGGSGAANTVMSTAGTLISAGLFTGGDRSTLNGDTVSVGYSMAV